MTESRMYQGDCLKVMEGFQPGKFDMVITSPPYNVGVNYDEKGFESDHTPVDQYREWMDLVNLALWRALKSGGRYCLEIGGSGRNIPLEYFWQCSAFQVGFGFHSSIVIPHRKTNPCAWGSYLKADNCFTIPNYHALYVFYKDTPTKRGNNGNETTIQKEEWMEWTRGVWTINYSVGKIKGHPATFPVELPRRCMNLFGHKGDWVLDPFAGTGTTGIAAHRYGRNFVGIELSKTYFDMAERRLDSEIRQLVLEGIEYDDE